ncbi:hypothetical protein BU23DRAFT_633787 [Bimuria novae-zelandiae CBS 107.79]|uniref:Uncharacterized protein n=1 Tax=Bimuria novae-zelandiae CBS 107.79 TaxID=1447943 RepID=A0A6A5VFR0_9PLEO|nr:hypothetical protein BU23DRAFT_633787 [Bimuria novae-zelandiae CBS 107.79]
MPTHPRLSSKTEHSGRRARNSTEQPYATATSTGGTADASRSESPISFADNNVIKDWIIHSLLPSEEERCEPTRATPRAAAIAVPASTAPNASPVSPQRKVNDLPLRPCNSGRETSRSHSDTIPPIPRPRIRFKSTNRRHGVYYPNGGDLKAHVEAEKEKWRQIIEEEIQRRSESEVQHRVQVQQIDRFFSTVGAPLPTILEDPEEDAESASPCQPGSGSVHTAEKKVIKINSGANKTVSPQVVEVESRMDTPTRTSADGPSEISTSDDHERNGRLRLTRCSADHAANGSEDRPSQAVQSVPVQSSAGPTQSNPSKGPAVEKAKTGTADKPVSLNGLGRTTKKSRVARWVSRVRSSKKRPLEHR